MVGYVEGSGRRAGGVNVREGGGGGGGSRSILRFSFSMVIAGSISLSQGDFSLLLRRLVCVWREVSWVGGRWGSGVRVK